MKGHGLDACAVSAVGVSYISSPAAPHAQPGLLCTDTWNVGQTTPPSPAPPRPPPSFFFSLLLPWLFPSVSALSSVDLWKKKKKTPMCCWLFCLREWVKRSNESSSSCFTVCPSWLFSQTLVTSYVRPSSLGRYLACLQKMFIFLL